MAFEISSSNKIQNISVTYVSILLEILVSSLLICQNHRKYKEHQEFVEFLSIFGTNKNVCSVASVSSFVRR